MPPTFQRGKQTNEIFDGGALVQSARRPRQSVSTDGVANKHILTSDSMH